MSGWARPRRTHLWSFGLLIVHVAASAIVFVCVFTIGWLVSVALGYLDSVHKFPTQVYKLVTLFEVWLFYIDCAVTGIILATSLVKFVRDTLEGD